MSKSAPRPAAAVRTWFAGLSDAEKSQVRAPGERGRLHPDTVAAFTAATGETYKVGTPRKTVEVTYVHTQPSGRKVRKTVTMTDAEARALAGEAAGQRGPLSKAALAAAGENYVAKA